MDFREKHASGIDFRALRLRGTPLSEFRFGETDFRLSDDDSGDDDSRLPVRRDDLWQDMLRNLFGSVPEGAEHAPPCHCEIFPNLENYSFAGLAGLPPAVRLMDGFFPVRDQSKRGACFAFALVALCEYMLGKTVELSEQSLFHFTKLVTPGKVEDLSDGAIILDSIHAVEEYGICPLSEWHYNPESWNYVEDPYNEGQGKALQRKLEAAQPYRFRNWRTLSRGSVLQFKQALSSKRPIYTGVLVTSDWDAAEVRATGRIPYPKLLWTIRILPPPGGVVLAVLEQNGVEPDEDNVSMVAKNLMSATLRYLEEAVFKKPLSILEAKEDEDGVRLAVLVNDIRGGHALCLAGYADDESYPGGGYFIARNSWSDDKWAPESPEMPGYALLPYAYVADFAQEGMVMAEFPDVGGATSGTGAPLHVAAAGGMRLDASATGAAAGAGATRKSWLDALQRRTVATDGATVGTTPFMKPSSVAAAPAAASPMMPPPAVAGFEAWLAARKSVLSKPTRDASGVLLRPGTRVLVPDPRNPDDVMGDTPENREVLRQVFDAEEAEASAKRLRDAVKAIVDESLERLDPPDAEVIRKDLLRRFPELPCPAMEWIENAMHELAAQYPDKYKIGTSFDGRFEEIQKACKN